MKALLDDIAELRKGRPQALLDSIPYARFMGIQMRCHEDGVSGFMAFDQTLVGNPQLPALHGGAVAALLESTAIFQALWASDSGVLPKTINLTVQYLRSGRPQDTHAKATLIKQGRRVIVARVRAWQEDPERPIAAASAQFLLTPS